MVVISELITALSDVFAKLVSAGHSIAELYQAFLIAVGDVLRFLEGTGLNKGIIDVIFNALLKIFGA